MSGFAQFLFGRFFREKRAEFQWLRPSLLAAQLNVSMEQYLSTSAFYSFFATIFVSGLAAMVVRFFFGFFPVWHIVARLPAIQWMDALRLLAELLLVVIVPAVSFFAMFLVFVAYPRILAWERKRKIDGYIPYAIGWMASMASVGIIPFVIFKKMAEAEEYYHEVSEEARHVVRDVELLGFDLITAMKNLAEITPSLRMRVFLQGAITASLAGGEMGEYFISKAMENMEDNRKRFQDFINTLGMIAEVYVVALVAGPLFIIILFAAMMMMGGANPAILQAIVYFMIPTGSVLFILLIDSLTPGGMK